MPLIGAVADDLTGATTTGVLLARSKARAAVFFDADGAEHAENMEKLDGVIISANSRPLPADEAYRAVRDATRALMDMGVKYFQKRIDTTCRGGIGVEIDAMLDTIGSGTVAIVVPSMPYSRRILVGGFSVIDGVALTRTPAAQDVRTPVKECFVPRLIAGQTRRRVGLVTLDVVLKGSRVICGELLRQREEGVEVFVVDAISIEDVTQIAEAAIRTGWNFITVDPGALTVKTMLLRGLIQNEEDNAPPQGAEDGKTVLVAAGSATSVTKKQMEGLLSDPRHVRISVDPEKLIDGGEAAEKETGRAVNAAAELIMGDMQPRAVLFETALHGTLLDLGAEEEKRHLASGAAADRINRGIGQIVKRVIDRTGRDRIAGIYATGGDTMVCTCNALGANCLEMLDHVIPQTDIGVLSGGAYDGLPVIGKGGLTGYDSIVRDIVTRLFCEAARVR